MNNTHYSGVLLVAAAALCWSCGGVFLKFVDANIFVISACRYAVGLVAMMALNRSIPAFRVKNDEGITDKKDTAILWLGGLMYAVCSFTYVVANRYTTAANAILLQYTNPVWIIAFGPVLLKEKNKPIDYIAIAGVFIGMCFFFAGELFKGFENIDGRMMFGNIVAIISGFFMASYTMTMRLQKNGKTVESSMLSQLIGLAVTFPAIIVFGLPSGKSCVFLLLTGIINGALALFLYPLGLKKIPAFTASLIGVLEPLMNPLWVFIFVGEVPGPLCILGGIIILGFVVFRTIYTEILARRQ